LIDAASTKLDGLLSDFLPDSPQGGRAFICAKCAAPIPALTALARRALILAALDPAILAITPARPPGVALLHRATGVSVLIVHSSPQPPHADGLTDSTPVEFRTATEIATEPRSSNAAAVWSTRTRFFAVGDQVRVLAHLDEVGAAPLIELARSIVSSPDAVAAVLALACRGLIAVDLETEPIGPETLVRRVRKPV
jgi:hypothetical protein